MSKHTDKKPMVYLTIPYKGRECESYEIANKVAFALMFRGYTVFSAISHSHAIADMGEYEISTHTQDRHDRAFIDSTDEVFVICAEGWDRSRVSSQIDYANELGKRVRFLDMIDNGDGEVMIKDHSCKQFEPFTIELD